MRSDIEDYLGSLGITSRPTFETKAEYRAFVNDFYKKIKPHLDENHKLQIQSERDAMRILQ